MTATTNPPNVSETVTLAPGTGYTAAERLVEPGLQQILVQAHRELESERRQLLLDRAERQRSWDAGEHPTFVPEGELPAARTDWQVRELPTDLLRRRVEITGPINDRKMVINMLSRNGDGTRADAAMLDFEDSMKPSWTNVLAGLHNLIGAARGELEYTRPATPQRTEKHYRLDADDRPLVMVRVRGLHLDESNVLVDQRPISAGLFDFVASAYHSARVFLEQGRTPKFYVPKCEHYREARWWNRLFELTQEALGLHTGTIRATFLIETLPAAFQIEEILYEIRDHAAGMNVGRWDKIFSDIKVLKEHEDRVLADRATISLNKPWMRDYALQLVKLCHRHGAFGMGGMAAFTPGQTPERREEQLAKVRADKQQEADMGHDGCWVSHPYFLGAALSAFERDNQRDVLPDIEDQPRLLPRGCEPHTLEGLRTNVRVGIAYLQGWNDDIGCVAWDDLMEDLATLEISRAQTWQWLRHAVELEDGTVVDRPLVARTFQEEADRIERELRESGAPESRLAAFRDAAADAEAIFCEREFREFLALASDPADADPAERRRRLRGD